MNKIFVSGFPLEYTELDLARLFAPHGDIDTIKIVRDRKTGICKGYAFIEMKTEDGVTQAITELNDTPIADRSLTVTAVEEKPAAPVSRRPQPPRPTNFPASQRPKRPRNNR